MSKPLVAFYGPVDCYSGYSAHSRELIKSLIKIRGEEWDIRILSCPWGGTRKGFLNKDKPEDREILNRILPNLQLPKQPEVFISCTIPSEFQSIGKHFNIGITAGIETTICDPSWITGINRMNLVLVSSQHAKNTFMNSKFEKKDNNTGNIVEIIEVISPIEVLFEGSELNKYFKIDLK